MNKLEEIYQVFAEIFAPSEIVIAGGAVRDTLMGRTPKDYDIFILNEPFNNWDKYLSSRGAELKLKLQKYPKMDMVIEWHKKEYFLIDSIEYEGKDVQIMASPYKDVNELLSDEKKALTLQGMG